MPNSEVTPISPPIFSIIIRQMESPKPVPCTKLFSLTKRSKICPTFSFFYSYSRIFHIYTDILPFSFKSETYLSRMGKLGSVGDKIRNDLHNTIRIALHLQVLLSIIKDEVHPSFYTFLVNSIDCPADFPRFIGRFTYSNVPASIFDKSNISLISCNKMSEFWLIISE